MRDLPFFTTENGVASLTLSDIPYTQRAYIRLQQATVPEKLLQETVAFCRGAGGEKIYCTGHWICERYPLHTSILKMQAPVSSIPDIDASLFPVTEDTLYRWCDIYNDKVCNIPNGAWMTQAKAKKLLQDADAYFIHKTGHLLGIGKASGDRISWLASVSQGAGEDIIKALCHTITADTVSVEVASANHKAIKLYDRMGFLPVEELSRWYCVIDL